MNNSIFRRPQGEDGTSCLCIRSYSETANCLSVDQSTVRRTVVLFDQTGSVAKRKYPDTHGDHLRKVADVDKLLVLEREKPGIYLRDFLWKKLGQKLISAPFVDF